MKRNGLFALCLLGFLTCYSPARAQESVPPSKLPAPVQQPPLQLPVPEAFLKETQNLWFGVYMNGTKAGWGKETRAPGNIDGTPCLTVGMEMTMEMKALDNVMQVDMAIRKHFAATPPHRALLIEETQKMMKQERRVVLRHKEGNTYIADITEAGKTKQKEVTDLDLFLWHETTPELWAADPARKPGDSITTVEYSSDKMKAGLQTATILRETDWAAPGGKVAAWELSFFDHEEDMRGIIRVSRADGSMVNALFGQVIEVRCEPEAVATAKPDGEQPDFFMAMSIPADRAMGRSPSLAEVVLELTAPEGKELPDLPNTVNQTVERNSDRQLTLRITPGKGKPRPATEEERASALKATNRYPLGEEEIKKLAAKAVDGAKTDREKVEKLLRFTDYYIRDSMETEPLTVMDLIKNRKGDCSAHALLFTTLARAAGIPSNEAGGWMYMGNEYKAFGGHAWNEVILDGHWVPVDPLWKQMQLDAGHIQQHAGDINGSSIQGMISGLKAKVISFKKR